MPMIGTTPFTRTVRATSRLASWLSCVMVHQVYVSSIATILATHVAIQVGTTTVTIGETKGTDRVGT
jgi:hypothetical protein